MHSPSLNCSRSSAIIVFVFLARLTLIVDLVPLLSLLVKIRLLSTLSNLWKKYGAGLSTMGDLTPVGLIQSERYVNIAAKHEVSFVILSYSCFRRGISWWTGLYLRWNSYIPHPAMSNTLYCS